MALNVSCEMTAAVQTQRPATHNLGLDVVRASAILAVLFSHTSRWWLGDGAQTPILSAYAGRIGVELFFSLSGFLIGGILLRDVETGFGPGALRRFWTRRWLRTLPAYWTLILVLNWHYGTADWRSLVFLQNFVPKTQWTPLAPHTWSLVLEEWFYLFVPLMLLGLLRLLGRTRARWGLPVLCCGLIAVCTVARTYAGVAPSAVWGPEPDINPLLRLDCAAFGVLAACLVRRMVLPRGAAAALLAIGAMLLVLLGLIWVGLFAAGSLDPWGVRIWGAAYPALRAPLEELASACIVLGMHRLLPRGAGVPAWCAGSLARLSYALYLVHVPVVWLSRGAGLDDAQSWAARAGIAALVLAMAVAMRVLVELPALALRDWIERRSVRRRPAISVS